MLIVSKKDFFKKNFPWVTMGRVMITWW